MLYLQAWILWNNPDLFNCTCFCSIFLSDGMFCRPKSHMFYELTVQSQQLLNTTMTSWFLNKWSLNGDLVEQKMVKQNENKFNLVSSSRWSPDERLVVASGVNICKYLSELSLQAAELFWRFQSRCSFKPTGAILHPHLCKVFDLFGEMQ